MNKQYEVFPAYDRLICWQDEIHGGTGPTLAGAAAADTTDAGDSDAGQAQQQQVQQQQAEQQPEAEEGAWSAEDMEAGRPLAQQRRRLLASRGAATAAQPARRHAGAAATAGAAAAGGGFLFDVEKKPAKLLHFVSAGQGAAAAAAAASLHAGCPACLHMTSSHHPPLALTLTATHCLPALPCPALPCLPARLQLLPDLSEERWQYVGTEVFKETGDSAHVYEWDLTGGCLVGRLEGHGGFGGGTLPACTSGNSWVGGWREGGLLLCICSAGGLALHEQWSPRTLPHLPASACCLQRAA